MDGEDEEPEYDGVVYDATCPVCGEEISFDEETLETGSIQCPNCGELLEFDLGEEEAKPEEEDAPECFRKLLDLRKGFGKCASGDNNTSHRSIRRRPIALLKPFYKGHKV